MNQASQFAPSPYLWVPPRSITVPNGRSVAGLGLLRLSRPRNSVEAYGLRHGIPLLRDLQSAGLAGLGAQLTGSAATADSIATSGAATTVAILGALSIIPGGAVVAAAIGGIIALAGQIAKLFGGCGQTCVLSSQDANQVGDYMTQNLNTYLAAPVHYASLQSAALNNFDTAWASLVAACSNPQLGTAGQNCISERQQGACYWKASPGGWSQTNGTWTYTGYGQAGSGSACWNYFVGMRDPIANDPTVVPDPVAGSSTSSASTSGSTTASSGAASTGTTSSPDLAPLLLVGGLIGLAFLL